MRVHAVKKLERIYSLTPSRQGAKSHWRSFAQFAD